MRNRVAVLLNVVVILVTGALLLSHFAPSLGQEAIPLNALQPGAFAH